MKSNTLLLLLLISVSSFSLLNFFQTSNRINESTYQIIEDIIAKQVFIETATLLIERSVEILSLFFPDMKGMKVNSTASDNQISIIIVDTNDSDYAQVQKDFIEKVRSNKLLTVGNRYIVMDINFLYLLLLSSLNEFLSEIEVEDQVFDEFSAQRSFDMKRMLLISNTYKYMVEQEPDESTIKILHFYNAQKNTVGLDEYFSKLKILNWRYEEWGLMPLIVHNMSNLPRDEEFSFGDTIAVPFSSIFAFYLLHEFGHIKSGIAGSFLSQTVGLINEKLADINYAEELKADKYASSQLLSIQLNDKYKYNFGDYSYDLSRGIYSGAMILDSMAFYTNLHDFREMNIQSIGSLLVYKQDSCNNSERGFFEANNIEKTIEVMMPIVTREEFDKIYVNELSAARHTHPHLYNRSRTFSVLANNKHAERHEGQTTYTSQVRKVLTSGISDLNNHALSLAYQADLIRLYPNLLKIGVPFPKDSFATHGFERKIAASCPFDECEILTNNDGLFIELGFNKDRLVYATLYIRILSMKVKKGWNQPWEESNEASIRRYIKNLMVITVLIQNIFGSESKQVLEDPKFENFFKRFADCYFASHEIVGSNGTMKMSTTDNDKSFYLNFISK